MRMGIFSCRRRPNFSQANSSFIYENIKRAKKTLGFFLAFAQSAITKQLLFSLCFIVFIIFSNEVLAQDVEFTLYAIDSTTDELITLDPSTGEPTTIGPIGFDDVNGLAYDSTTNTLFGADNATGQLIKIDTTTGQGTAVGLIGLGGLISDPGHLGIAVTDLTFGPNNTLFALTNTAFSTSRLITINTETGVGTLVSGEISQQLDGLSFQPRTGKMYASFRFTSIGGLFEIDPANGDLTDLGPVGIQIFRLSADPNADKLFGIFSSAFPGTTELWSIDLTSLTKSQIGTINTVQISISGLETAVFQEVEGPPGDPTCSDGIDNDDDGSTDSNDSDCDIASIFNNSVTVDIIGTSADTLSAKFTPNFGLSLIEIEELTGYDHFNWVNIVTKDNILKFPLLNSLQGLNDLNGDLPKVPYFDPVAGGYQRQADQCGTDLPVKDNLPWYWDEVYDYDCKTATDPFYFGPEVEQPNVVGPNILGFQDIPDSPANIEFLTALVGVNSDGTGNILHFDGTVFRWKFDGGLDELIFFPDLSLKNFDDFTEEEIELLEAIPIIRGNIDPDLVSGTGNLEILGTVEPGYLTNEELLTLKNEGIGVHNSMGLIHDIDIDIEPWIRKNIINLRLGWRFIPVAILTTSEFNATNVDVNSVKFGPAEATNKIKLKSDVDRDGDKDVILFFKIRETGIECGQTEAILSGKTIDGSMFLGVDPIKTIGCK